MLSKNKEFMCLLGFKAGDYAIDGCVIGLSKTVSELGRSLKYKILLLGYNNFIY